MDDIAPSQPGQVSKNMIRHSKVCRSCEHTTANYVRHNERFKVGGGPRRKRAHQVVTHGDCIYHYPSRSMTMREVGQCQRRPIIASYVRYIFWPAGFRRRAFRNCFYDTWDSIPEPPGIGIDCQLIVNYEIDS